MSTVLPVDAPSQAHGGRTSPARLILTESTARVRRGSWSRSGQRRAGPPTGAGAQGQQEFRGGAPPSLSTEQSGKQVWEEESLGRLAGWERVTGLGETKLGPGHPGPHTPFRGVSTFPADAGAVVARPPEAVRHRSALSSGDLLQGVRVSWLQL